MATTNATPSHVDQQDITDKSHLDSGSDKHSEADNGADVEKAGDRPADGPQKPASEAPAGPPGGPPPNGGLKAWLQVLGSWMLFFNTWGILNTFGVYQVRSMRLSLL